MLFGLCRRQYRNAIKEALATQFAHKVFDRPDSCHRVPNALLLLALLDRVLREAVQRRNLVQPQERVRFVAE